MNAVIKLSGLDAASDASSIATDRQNDSPEAAPRLSAEIPNPEVPGIVRRRKFSSAEKRRILHAADRCTKPGAIGALLRREHLYSSMLTGWRKQRQKAEQAALAPQRRGPKANPAIAQRRHDEQLTRDNARLRRQLEHANAIIDVQKKLCTLLGLPTAEQPESSS